MARVHGGEGNAAPCDLGTVDVPKARRADCDTCLIVHGAGGRVEPAHSLVSGRMAERNAIQRAFDDFAGFEKKSGSWYRISGEVISVSNLQKSQYGPVY